LKPTTTTAEQLRQNFSVIEAFVSDIDAACLEVY
jgi:hypothetical protein